jgi:6-phospho-beta-glucosidase
MSRTISLCIVGAGSSYTPELIDGLLNQPPDRLPVSSIAFTDIDPQRLEIMSCLAQRMILKSGREIAIRHSVSPEKMLEGADFVITQIRAGGMKARFLDESIPLKYGIIGQETTGPGGMFKALRTIPPMLEIARKVAQVAPDAFILNYTNPSGIITEAVTKFTKAKIIGLCSGIPGIQEDVKKKLSRRFPDLQSYCVGLNHLGFIHKFVSKDRDVSHDAIEELKALYIQDKPGNASVSQVRLIELLGAVPIGYVHYYFSRSKRLGEARRAYEKGECRSQMVMKAEKEILEEATDQKVNYKPRALSRRGGSGYASVTFRAMESLFNDSGDTLATSAVNNGSVDGIEADAVVEVVCRIDKSGAHPLPVGPIPLAFRGIVQAVKTYETLTIGASVSGDRRLALQAMLNHPLMGDLDICEPLFDEMCAAHALTFPVK